MREKDLTGEGFIEKDIVVFGRLVRVETVVAISDKSDV
jgi:hypothetical protein